MQKAVLNGVFWASKSSKRRLILLSLNQPMTKTEIERKLSATIGVHERKNFMIKEFIDMGLLRVVSSGRREGRVYSLTDAGKELAGIISRLENIPWHYSEPDIDWNLYGSLVCGRRKLKVLGDIVKKGRVTTVREKYRVRVNECLKDMPRSYKYKVLDEFLKSGLVQKVVEKGVPIYTPTEKGRNMIALIA
jgi:DNA-binding PadR family transcriptional regulator